MELTESAEKHTILSKLVDTSQKKFQNNFNQTQIRQKIINEKSMFKDNLRLKDVFTNQDFLYRKVVGQAEDPSVLPMTPTSAAQK